MKYSHRWYYVTCIFVLLIILLIASASSHIAKIFELRKSVVVLEQRLAQLAHVAKTVVEQQAVTKEMLTSYTLLPTLSQLVNLSGLTLTTANMLAPVSIGMKHWKVHVVVTGSYRQMTELLLLLDKQSFAVLLLNFTYHPIAMNKLMLDAELLVLANCHDIPTVIPASFETLALRQAQGFAPQDERSVIYNPFCISSKLPQAIASITELTKFPLDQLRMIGYYHWDDDNQALMLLPNNHVVAIKAGDQIGASFSKVINIDQSKIIVSTGRDMQTLTMRNSNV